MSINKLNSVDAIALSDLWAIFSQSAGDDRRVSGTALLTFLNANLTFPGSSSKSKATKVFSTPITSGTVTVTDGSANYWVIITPAGTLADLEIKLPAVANVVDLQEILVVCTQVITALTFDVNDATDIIGEPTALAANESFKIKYDSQTGNWYNIQAT